MTLFYNIENLIEVAIEGKQFEVLKPFVKQKEDALRDMQMCMRDTHLHITLLHRIMSVL